MSRAAAAFIALALVAGTAGAQGTARKNGDVNNDGNVTSVDALAVLNHVVGLADAAGFTSSWGDANCDGKVTSVDAQIILAHTVALDVAQFCVNKVPTQTVALVTVDAGTGQVMVGGTLQLSATPRDSTNAALTGRTITWSSSDNTRATVSTAGLVTGVAIGDVTITATADGKSGITAVTVLAASAVATMDLSPRTTTVLKDSTVTLTATVKDGAGNAIAGRTITWSVEKSSVLEVTTSGVVKGIALGTSKVYATSQALKDSATITVTATGATATRTWTGATSTDWGTAGNWNPAAIPVVTDTVFIPAQPANQPVLNQASTTIAGLVVQTGARVTVGTNELQVTGRADVDGEVLGTGRLVMQGVSSRESYLRGKLPNLRIIGTTITVGAITVTGDLEVTPTSVFDVNGFTVKVSQDLLVRGGLRMQSSLGKLDVDRHARFFNDATTTSTILNAGILNVGGNFTVVVPGAAANPFPVGGTHRTVLDGAAQQFVRDSGLVVAEFQELDVANTAGGIVFEAADTARFRVKGRMSVLTGTSISGNGRVNVMQNYTQAAGGTNTLRNLAVGRAFASGAGFKPDTLTVIGTQILPTGTAYQFQTLVAAAGTSLSGTTTTAGSVIIGCLTLYSDCGVSLSSGSVTANGQKLFIGKDLRQSSASGYLFMTKAADSVVVAGSLLGPVGATQNTEFTTDSTTWSAGVLRVAGDFRGRGTGARGTHVTILDGKTSQLLRIVNGFEFQALIIADSAGVVASDTSSLVFGGATVHHRNFVVGVKGDFNISTPVKLTGTGRVAVKGNVQTVTGSGVEVKTITVGQTLQAAGTFTPDTVVFTNTGTAQTIQNLPDYNTVRVSGKAAFGGSFTLKGLLIVDTGAELNMESRHVTVTKSAIVGGILRMQDARDTLTVLGDSAVFPARNDPAVKNYATSGVLRVSGRLVSDSTGFYPTGTHKTVWTPKSGATTAGKTLKGVYQHLEVTGQNTATTGAGNSVTVKNVYVRGNLTATAGATKIFADSLYVTGDADISQADTIQINAANNDTTNASVFHGNLKFNRLLTSWVQVKGNVTVVDGGLHASFMRYYGTWTEGANVSMANSRAALAKVVFTKFVQPPTTTKAGTPFSPAISVEIVDATGTRVVGTAAVTISGAGIPQTRALTVNGVVTFPNLVPTTASTTSTLQVTVTQGTNYLQNSQFSQQFTVTP